MGRWSFYIIFGAVQLMLSMVSRALRLHQVDQLLLQVVQPFE
jgi:hypothetical protein